MQNVHIHASKNYYFIYLIHQVPNLLYMNTSNCLSSLLLQWCPLVTLGKGLFWMPQVVHKLFYRHCTVLFIVVVVVAADAASVRIQATRFVIDDSLQKYTKKAKHVIYLYIFGIFYLVKPMIMVQFFSPIQINFFFLKQYNVQQRKE